MGFTDALDIGTNLLGAYSEYNKGQAASGIIGHDRKVNQLNTDLELRSAGKRRKSAAGAAISRAAGSGVQLNLEDIARMESEYLMDEAVIREEGRIGQAVSRANQKTAKSMAKTKIGERLYQAGKGAGTMFNKTETGKGLKEKLGDTKFGAWLQT